MKKIKFLLISFLLLFLITFLYLMINDKCKSLSIYRSTLDFGMGNIQACVSLNNMRKNVKKKLINFPFLHDLAIKLYVNYLRLLLTKLILITLSPKILFNIKINYLLKFVKKKE